MRGSEVVLWQTLEPEIARHHQLSDDAHLEFNSRRLHHSTRLRPAFGEPEARSWQALRRVECPERPYASWLTQASRRGVEGPADDKP